MKRTILACATLATFTFPALAEAQASVGFRGGLTRTDLSVETDDTNVEFGSKTGIVLGGFVQFPMGESLGLQTGLNYTQKGSEFTDEDGTADLELDYFEVPLLAVYAIPSSGPFGVRLMGGPVVSLESSCEVSGEVEGVETTADCEDLGIGTKSVDFGIQVGGGAIYDIQGVAALFLDVGYNFGLTNIDDDPDEGESAKNRALLVSVGVDFPLGY